MLARALALLTIAWSAGGSVGAQPITADPNRWRPVAYSDLQLPGEAALPYASLWSDQLQRNNRAYEARGDRRFAAAIERLLRSLEEGMRQSGGRRF